MFRVKLTIAPTILLSQRYSLGWDTFRALCEFRSQITFDPQFTLQFGKNLSQIIPDRRHSKQQELTEMLLRRICAHFAGFFLSERASRDRAGAFLGLSDNFKRKLFFSNED